MPYEQFAYVYDKLMKDMPYDEWLAVVKKSWEQFGKPQKAADLGCGTGSLSIRLASEQVTVYGVDYSNDMLAVAMQKVMADQGAAPIARNIQWLEQDMRDWSVPEPLDAVYSFCDSLNYILDPKDIGRVFQSVRLNVKPGGVFMFDLLSEAQYERYDEEQPFCLNDEELAYIWTSGYDRENKIISHDLSIFVQEGELYRRIDEYHEQRAYSQDFIEQCLNENGFKLVNVTADFTDYAPTNDSTRIFYTAIRQQ